MALVAKRKLDATWREAVEARAREMRPGAAGACLAHFDRIRDGGGSEAEAAYRALEAEGFLWSVEAPGLTPAAPTGRHEVPSV